MAQNLKAPWFSVSVNNNTLSSADLLRVESITITQNVNQIGTLQLISAMSNYEDGRWSAVDDGVFHYGASISVSLGFADSVTFDGYITSVSVQFGDESSITVSASDKLFILQSGARTRSFSYMTDSAIVAEVAGESGITTSISALSLPHEYMVQDNQSDFDFISQRLQANLYDFIFRDGELHGFRALMDKILDDAIGVHSQPLVFQQDFDSFQVETHADQFGDAIIVEGYDPDQAAPVFGVYGASLTATLKAGLHQELTMALSLVAQAAMSPGSSLEIAGTLADATASLALAEVEVLAEKAIFEGPDGIGNISSLLNLGTSYYVRDSSITGQAEAELKAVLEYYKKLQPYMNGSGSGPGLPGLQAGTYVELEGLGKKTSGDYYVTGVTHSYQAEQGYTTQFQVRRRWYEKYL